MTTVDLDELRRLLSIQPPVPRQTTGGMLWYEMVSVRRYEDVRERLAAAVPPLLERLAAVETRAAAAERELVTLRLGCQAALIDWKSLREANENDHSGRHEFVRGCQWALDGVIGLLQKILDGTVTDLDFDEAEYADMLAGIPADQEESSHHTQG